MVVASTPNGWLLGASVVSLMVASWLLIALVASTLNDCPPWRLLQFLAGV
jgi:hypothetical protein